MAQRDNQLSAPSHSKAVRKRLSHPVIDSDGHLLEVEPILIDYLKQVGGSRLVKLYENFMSSNPYDKWHSQQCWRNFGER